MTVMNWLQGYVDLSNAIATLGANLLVQTTLVIGGGLFAAWLCRRRGAAVQSAILRVTLVASLVCPVTSWVLSTLGVPGFRVVLPQGSMRVAEAEPQPGPVSADGRELPLNDASIDSAPKAIGDSPLRRSGIVPFNKRSVPGGVLTPMSDSQVPADAPAEVIQESEPPEEAVMTTAASTAIQRPSALAVVYGGLAGAWMVVAGLLIARLAVANLLMWRIRRTAHPASAELTNECGAIATALNVAAPPVLVGSQITSPCLIGWWRPVILLPKKLKTISGDALAHELAHLLRRDCLWNLISRLSVAALPMQPLLWVLARRMEDAADEVCDDFVVRQSQDRASYARELVDIAERFQPDWSAATAGVGIAAFKSSLGKRVLRILDTSRLLSTHTRVATLLLILAVGICGVLAAGLMGAPGNRPLVAEVGDSLAIREQPTPSDAPAQGDNLIVIRGRVVDPDGKPFAGATIYALGWYWSPNVKHVPLAESKSKSDGRFEISYRDPKLTENVWFGHMSPDLPTIAAVASNFGPAFIRTTDLPHGDELTLKLVRDDVPIAGRVLDLEGRPVAGVKITVRGIEAPKGDDLTAWLEATRLGEVPLTAQRFLDARLPDYDLEGAAGVVTDAAGRFRITGVGRERVATLLFEGPSIAYNQVDVVTRRIKSMQQVIRSFDKQTRPLYGADLELTASPTKPIVGTVRDAETGQPLAGVTVANSSWPPGVPGHRLIRTVTDQAGRYRLTGLPKTEIEIVALPNDEQPYFMREAVVPDSAGLNPVTVDFELHRGLWITGRITDKATGEPAPAYVIYFPFLSNEYAQKRTPEFNPEKGKVDGYNERYTTRPDGSFRLVGLSGRAIVGAACRSRSYRFGVGADAIEGLDKFGHFPTFPNNIWPGPKWPNSMKEINPPEGAESVTCDLQLDPGASIRVSVLDPDDKPLTNYRLDGNVPHYGSFDACHESSFDVSNLGPDETRVVVIHHEGRNLGKVVQLQLAEHPMRALKVTLEPCATVLGRLLMSDGDPVPGATLEFRIRPSEDFGKQLPAVATDKDGQFRHAAVLPGCDYSIYVQGIAIGFQTVAEKLSAKPGETIDLGDVRLTERDQAAESVTIQGRVFGPPGRDSDVLTVKGRVLDPDGNPFAGATIYALRWYWSPKVKHIPLAEATSAADGQFEISYRKSQFTVDVQRPEMWKEVEIAAVAKGFGPGWSGWRGAGGTELTLRLVRDEVPITGRVQDLEGRPIAGVKIRISGVSASDVENLDGWLAAIEAGEVPWTAYRHLPKRLPHFVPGVVPSEVTTDASGRFRIAGIGRERKVDLVFEGPTIAYSEVSVVTRPRKPLTQKLQTYFDDSTQQAFGADFEFAAAPTQPIVGTVRDAKTGKPLPGVGVESWIFAGTRLADYRVLKSTTDQSGHFRLVGMPKGKGNQIIAIPNDEQPYFMRHVEVPEATGLDPISVDVELHRGIWITGRLTDKVTGEPVSARVHYLPFLSNPYAQRLPDEFDRHGNVDGFQQRYVSRPDGSYRLVGLPGRAILGAECIVGRSYRYGVGSDAIEGMNEHGHFETWQNPVNPSKKWPNTMKEINPPEGSESVTCDLEFDPGETVRIHVVGPDGDPISGFRVDGRTARHDSGLPTEQSVFDAINLGPGETRTIVIRHEGSGLGKVIRASTDGDRSRTMTVKLEPCVTVTGRLLNGEGDPVRGAAIQAHVLPSEDFGKLLAPVTTDEDGCFRYTVPSGCAYFLQAEGAEIGYQTVADNVSAKPGETVELRDVRLKARK